MEVLIVVVNYNGMRLTVDCLESLVPEVVRLEGIEIALCDNGSNSAEAAELARTIAARGWDRYTTFTRLNVNLGFTGGNNAVIRRALMGPDPPNYVILLNNDTIVRPGAVDALVRFMRARSDVGIAGSRLEDPDGTPQISAFRFLNPFAEFDRGLRLKLVSRMLSRHLMRQPVPDREIETDWVAGASMIIRREVLEEIGLLDEGYYTYFDDIDYCFMARQRNWPTWYVPSSRVVHLVGQTTGVTNRAKLARRKPDYYYAARRRYLTKNMSPPRAVACDIAFAVGSFLHKIRCFVTRSRDAVSSHELWDHLRQSTLVRGFRPPLVVNPTLGTANPAAIQGGMPQPVPPRADAKHS